MKNMTNDVPQMKTEAVSDKRLRQPLSFGTEIFDPVSFYFTIIRTKFFFPRRMSLPSESADAG